eukprot:543201_1
MSLNSETLDKIYNKTEHALHSIYSTALGFIHSNTNFDVIEQKQREISCRYILSSIRSNGIAVPGDIRFFVPTSIIQQNCYPQCGVEHILSIEFINNEEQVHSTLMELNTKFEQIPNAEKRYGLLRNLHWIAIILTRSSLMTKYLFNSNQCKFSKILIKSIINGLIINIPLLYEKIVLNEPMYTDWGIKCKYILLRLAKYWKFGDFVFAIDNGLCTLIASLWHFSIKSNIDSEPSSQDFETALTSRTIFVLFESSVELYGFFKYHAKKMNRKNNVNVAAYFKSVLMSEMGASYYSFKSFIRSNGRLALYNVYSQIKSYYQRDKCEWILCNKEKNEFKLKSKCKGCRLVQYCSRNHQKSIGNTFIINNAQNVTTKFNLKFEFSDNDNRG